MVGVIIVIVGVLVTAGILCWGYYTYKRDVYPPTFYKTVGIRYLDDTIKPWLGMEAAIDAIEEIITAEYPTRVKELMDFWVEVVPYHGLCRSQGVPTGYVSVEGKMRRANGTVRSTRALSVGPVHWVCVVRQLREGDSPDQSNMALGTGNTKSAGLSALFHEHAQHFVSIKVKRAVNSDHTDEQLNELTRKMHLNYANRYKG